MRTHQPHHVRAVAAAVITEFFYGISFIFTKDATTRVDPFTLLGWRFLVALVVLLLLWAARVVRLRITAATLRPLLVLALLQPVLYYVGETFGVARTTASESGLLVSAIPVVALLASVAVLRVHPTRPQVAGILVTLAEVVLTVVAGGLSAGFDAWGYLFLVAAVVAYSLYSVFAQLWSHAREIDKTFVMVASGAIVFGGITVVRHAADGTLPALATLPAHDLRFGGSVLFLALGPTIAAFFLQNVAIGTLGSNGYATFIGLSALVAVLSGSLVLGEHLSPAQWAGGVLILGGVYVANRRRPIVPAVPT